MHLASLERFPFDSVLLPYNFTMLAQPDYAADVEALLALCRERGVAVQTIKAIARRRWRRRATGAATAGTSRSATRDALRRAVRFVLARPGLFLNSSSDATLLPALLAAAAEPVAAPTDARARSRT